MQPCMSLLLEQDRQVRSIKNLCIWTQIDLVAKMGFRTSLMHNGNISSKQKVKAV
jgi:hypothetical protein